MKKIHILKIFSFIIALLGAFTIAYIGLVDILGLGINSTLMSITIANNTIELTLKICMILAAVLSIISLSLKRKFTITSGILLILSGVISLTCLLIIEINTLIYFIDCVQVIISILKLLMASFLILSGVLNIVIKYKSV